MTDILCRWLNEELPDGGITPSRIPELFSSGYLFGSILSQHGIQEDFKTFINANTTEAKLNNFLRLEATFGLLNIHLDTNTAHDVMLEKQGVATKLLYQLYVALQRKEKQNLTGQSLRSMKSSGKAMLETMEKSFFHGRMKQMPRQVDLNFADLANRFKEKHREREERIVKELREEEEKLLQERKDACHKSLEKARQTREAQDQLYTKLKPITDQRTTPSKKTRTKGRDKQNKTTAKEVQADISSFEATHKGNLPQPPIQPDSTEDRPDSTDGDGEWGSRGPLEMAGTHGSGDYMDQLRKRIGDGNFAQKERERRRRKVLMDQMRALKNQQESHREELLVGRMLRQCQQEQRIATQLMQVRAEKENIRNNRIEQQRQFEERRRKDFEEYLSRQAELIESEKKEKKRQLEEERKHHQTLLEEKAALKKKRRIALASDTMDRILDFVFRICEYKAETGGLLPAKVVRDWKLKLLSGHPLYDLSSGSTPSLAEENESGKEAQTLLDDTDFFDYQDCRGVWSSPEVVKDSHVVPPPLNPVLAHCVHRLHKQVFPPKPPPDPPVFPAFRLKASCVGRPFSGADALLDRLAKDFEVRAVRVEKLVERAILECEEEEGATPVIESQSTLVQSHTTLSADVSCEDSQEDPQQQAIPTPVLQDGTGGNPSQTPTVDEPKEQATLTTEPTSVPLDPFPREEEHLTWSSLGKKALEASQQGTPIPDLVLVNLIVLQLRELSDGVRFVLADFPVTYEQAELLEVHLSGYTPQATPPKLRSILAGTEGVYLLIAPPPPDALPNSAHALDIVVHVEADTDVCMKRGVTGGDGSGSQEVLSGLASFDASWPDVEEFYSRFNNVVTVDGGQCEDDAYEDMKNLLSKYFPSKPTGLPSDMSLKKQSSGDALKQASTSSLKQASTSSLKQPSSTSLKQPSSQSLKQESSSSIKQLPSSPLKQSSSASLKQSSKASIKQETSKKVLEESSQVKVESKTEEANPKLKSEPEPEPGSDDWVYVDSSLPEEISCALAPKWPGIEKLYVTTCVSLFRNIRQGREEMYKYYAIRRREYSVYLQRPDVKQEYVTQWQQNYNALPDHLRREDVMKSEQHCRVDDLCDKLWDICDERKREAEEEKTRVASERWLEDRTGVLCNYFFMLIQTELIRFYETVQLQRDYYYAMEDPTPAEPLPSTQVPLIEMPTSVPADTVSMQNLLGNQESPPTHTEEEKVEEVLPKKGGQTSKGDVTKSATNVATKKLVLIPEKVPPPEPVEEKGGKKKGGAAVIDPPPSLEESGVDITEAIISHVTGKARTYVTATIAQLTQVLALPDLPAPSTPAPPTDTPKADDKGKGKKGKDKGDKGAGKKDKGGKTSGRSSKVPAVEEAPSTPAVSQDDLKKRQMLEKMRKEELFSLKQEGERLRTRVHMIETQLLNIVSDLKSNAEAMYNDMEQWLSRRYSAEVESVSKLAEVLREAIEDEVKILHELTLPGTQFTINEGSILFEPAPPPPMDPPTEEENPDYFTVNQLRMIVSEFKHIFPSGSVPFRSFIDTFKLLVSRSSGQEMLPAVWAGVRSCSSDVLSYHIRELLSLTDPEMIDWRRFIVAIAAPYPLPTSHDIVAAHHNLSQVAPIGLVGKDKFMECALWLDGDGVEGGAFSRCRELKELFFDAFVGTKTDQLHYFTLLLHLCADTNLLEGVHKALSLFTGSPVDTSLLQDTDQEVPLLSYNDCLRLHRFAYLPPQGGEDGVLVERKIQQFFSTSSSPGTCTLLVTDFLQSAEMEPIVANWSKLQLKALPEIGSPDHQQ